MFYMFCNAALFANDHWITIPGQSLLTVQTFHILKKLLTQEMREERIQDEEHSHAEC
jgi:hypothetical protein